MKRIAVNLIGCAVFGLVSGVQAESTMNVAHMHLEHVSTSWPEAPNQVGFMTVAMQEAEIAMTHVTLAQGHEGDLAALKMHVGHALHALDPEEQDAGPGLGFGVIEGADGAEKHTLYAAQSPGASDNIINNNLRVRNPLRNAESLAKLAVRAGNGALEARSVAAAQESLNDMAWLINAMINGVDENGNGTIEATREEGGLAIAFEQMRSIRQGEGLD
ncbi:hypothetical protein [Saccharospirillum impatiens]|uniref:hypothetical protein n=1 Tax=Saccharospirillum impatiens TaxID=169438 RepID=UPI00048A615B|nr:hypothetical protein [Saccharospirillum impatiens]